MEDKEQKISYIAKVTTVCLTIVSLFINIAIYPAIPQFAETFAAFGADLPGLTLVVLSTYQFYGLFALLGILPCIFLLVKSQASSVWIRRSFLLVGINFVLAFVIFGLVLTAMYLPILQLDSVV